MGISILSASESDGYKRSYMIEPNPHLFIIKQMHQIENHLVAVINYPNATNYEGNKILVFRNMTKEKLRSTRVIDPHFSEKGVAPFARFEPTAYGLEKAKELCNIL